MKKNTLTPLDVLLNLNHEINAPLNIITGFSEIMSRELGDLDVDHRILDYLESVRSSSINLSELFHNMFALFKTDQSIGGYRTEKVDIRLLIKTFHQIYKGQLREANVEGGYQIDPQLDTFLLSDRERLVLVCDALINIILLQEQTLLKLTLSAEYEDGGVALRLEGVFQDAVTSYDQLTEDDFLSRFGFQTLVSFLQQIHGKLVLGGGGANTMALKLIIRSDTQKLTANRSIKSLPSFKKNQSVLIVEDNPMNVKMMRLLLEKLDLKVTVAVNGQQAIDSLESHIPSLILMDWEMPVMDGMEATKIIKSNEAWQSIPITVLSANALKENTEEAIEAGADYYLTKPVVLYELIPALEKYLQLDEEASNTGDTAELIVDDTLKDEILKNLQMLQKVPYYLTSQLSKSIEGLRQLARDEDKDFKERLNRIENEYFNRRHEKAEKMIEEMIGELKA
jgi:CheY-like chemotaxis protein